MDTIDITKPYRNKYNEMDKIYTDKLKKCYMYIPSDIKIKFDRYTENLMDDNLISKKELIKAIESFELYNTNLNLFLYNEWCEFTTMAEEFNSKSYCNIL